MFITGHQTTPSTVPQAGGSLRGDNLPSKSTSWWPLVTLHAFARVHQWVVQIECLVEARSWLARRTSVTKSNCDSWTIVLRQQPNTNQEMCPSPTLQMRRSLVNSSIAHIYLLFTLDTVSCISDNKVIWKKHLRLGQWNTRRTQTRQLEDNRGASDTALHTQNNKIVRNVQCLFMNHLRNSDKLFSNTSPNKQSDGMSMGLLVWPIFWKLSPAMSRLSSTTFQEPKPSNYFLLHL